MGQAANVTNKDTALDTVITNALIVDAVTGIIKADVGIKVGADHVHDFFLNRTSVTLLKRSVNITGAIPSILKRRKVACVHSHAPPHGVKF